jgi:hypothetical protein
LGLLIGGPLIVEFGSSFGLGSTDEANGEKSVARAMRGKDKLRLARQALRQIPRRKENRSEVDRRPSPVWSEPTRKGFLYGEAP